MYRKLILLTLFGFVGVLSAQQANEFGVLNQFERDFKTYDKDTTANAIYLYEKGENYFEVRQGYIWLITKYHAKKKILKKQGFDEAEIEIPYYHSKKGRETVNKIKAMTHNGDRKQMIPDNKIFDVDLNESWSQKRFTFPSVQVGSVLEYSYEVQSPFFYNLTGWEFQDGIPKVYSEYNAMIPGNFKYNRSLVGEIGLDVNDATIKKNCFSVPGIPKMADCEVLKYVMNDVPAFKEDEEYMLSPDNYRAILEFELSEYVSLDGIKQKFTKTWNDVDKEFRSDKDIGGQLRKKNFFERNVPLEIITGDEGDLEKAKNVYEFVKSHYTWNNKYGIFRNNNVKNAFDEKKGNVAEINITLINLLNAAGIKTDIMLLSTRLHGLPKRNHPVMSDFNYVVAKTTIDGKEYLLDATEKQMPFGMLPYRCLNYYGRVMDLDGDSYWYDILPEKNSSRSIQVKAELMDDRVVGIMDDITMGHEAFSKRNEIASTSEEEYLGKIEKEMDDDFVIHTYEADNEKSDEKALVERFGFELENVKMDNTVFFNPFLVRFFGKNPFKSEKRYYPIDFGFLRNYRYMAKLKIPEGYKIKQLPEALNLALPDRSGLLRFECKDYQDVINVYFTFKLNSTQYNSQGYAYIKKFFEMAVNVQNQSYLVLEKLKD
ncbi:MULTISPECIES: DUF3857 and transglutaminase domain-containing protein [Flavobacteriaceae]|uniref:DUF3857 and transglutaminase domain-containing protein n=1 Tax=Flavobacteriaceae TaxID=49546 RepID=UPI00234A6574|nr:DUF3857 and transglutaminase domain-containing protein [Muricauda sp. SP22]MDC6361331.1 DUF3857 and transglutaminase domain-containing protein [Muricauda sp. SP22]